MNHGACLDYACSVACGLFQMVVLKPDRLNHTTISTFVQSYAADTTNNFSQALAFLEAAILVLAPSDQTSFSEGQSTFVFRTVEFLCLAFDAGDRLDALKRSFEALRPRLQDSSLLNQALAERLKMGFPDVPGRFCTSQSLAQDVWLCCASHPHRDIQPHTRIASFGDATYVVHCDFLGELDTEERDNSALWYAAIQSSERRLWRMYCTSSRRSWRCFHGSRFRTNDGEQQVNTERLQMHKEKGTSTAVIGVREQHH